VAIRFGRLPDSTLVARRLGVVPRVLVAAPRYLKRQGEPRAPADLEAHEFVFYLRRNVNAAIELTGPGGAHAVRVHGRITVNNVHGVRALVEAGVGLHLGPLWARNAR